MRAYSLDLRERVLAAVDGGTRPSAVASTFGISERTISRWLTRHQAGVPLAGDTDPGRPAGIPDTLLPALRMQLEAHPDATLAERLRLWSEEHPPISQSALAQGNPAQAQAYVDQILRYLASGTLQDAFEPLRVYLTCYEVLRAVDGPRADDPLHTAHELLSAWAAGIPAPDLRRSFFENIAVHQAIEREYGQVME